LLDGTHLALFLSAALMLAITPGPGLLYVLGRTLHGGGVKAFYQHSVPWLEAIPCRGCCSRFVMPSRGHLITQFLLLGATSVALNTAADLIVVVLAGAVTHKLKNNPKFTRRQRTASGVGMIGLGAYVAVSK
jgi:threonine/homoserine/homoserine lactone efflux protein